MRVATAQCNVGSRYLPNLSIGVCYFYLPTIKLVLCGHFFHWTKTFTAYVYIQFHILVHYYYLMDMIIMDVEVIFQDLDENVVVLPRDHPRRLEVQLILNSRIERIVKWHTSVFRYLKSLSNSSVIHSPKLFLTPVVKKSFIHFEMTQISKVPTYLMVLGSNV